MNEQDHPSSQVNEAQEKLPKVVAADLSTARRLKGLIPGNEVTPSIPPEPAHPTTRPIHGNVNDLSERIGRLENTIEQLQQSLQSATRQLYKANSRLDEMTANLQGTLGYRAHQSYVCDSCHAHGYVASRLTCTSCGKENWWGWWPAKQP